MGKLPVLKTSEVIAALQKLGFEIDHVTGSHYILRHPDGRRTVVPYHGNRDIKQGGFEVYLKAGRTNR